MMLLRVRCDPPSKVSRAHARRSQAGLARKSRLRLVIKHLDYGRDFSDLAAETRIRIKVAGIDVQRILGAQIHPAA